MTIEDYQHLAAQLDASVCTAYGSKIIEEERYEKI